MKKKMVVAVIDSGVNKMDGMLQEQEVDRLLAVPLKREK